MKELQVNWHIIKSTKTTKNKSQLDNHKNTIQQLHPLPKTILRIDGPKIAAFN